MKKILVLFVAFCCLFVSCQKENSLKEVDDVCTKIEDPNFMKYCYDNFDVNKDGKVSMQEAAAVKIISCSNRRITSLKGIEYFHTITNLDCINNNLSSLDISKNTQLTGLDCSGNDLTSLNLSKNSLLTILYCYNNILTSLDISKNSKLITLECNDNKLTSLDISENTELSDLRCYNNNLTSLDVSKNSKLFYLACNPQNGNRTITPTGWNK